MHSSIGDGRFESFVRLCSLGLEVSQGGIFLQVYQPSYTLVVLLPFLIRLQLFEKPIMKKPDDVYQTFSSF